MMRRKLSLRQVEAFKAVVEHGTISRAALALHVSAPAVSKIIATLEEDARLTLFDRPKGRLVPTLLGMRLYEEIDRIFSGVQQIENAIDAIQREEQGRISIGVMPALSSSFVQRATMTFLERHPEVFCEIESRSSQRISEWLLARELDIGLMSIDVDNPYLVSESLLEYPLVCAMAPDHPLTAKTSVQPSDVGDTPFISFKQDSPLARRISSVFESHRTLLDVALVATTASMLCGFVAAGKGISLVHPIDVKEFGKRLVARPFAPEIMLGYQICHGRENRNARLIQDFITAARTTAHSIMNDEARA